MPFVSDKQRRFLYANKPSVAKKFAKDSGFFGHYTVPKGANPPGTGMGPQHSGKDNFHRNVRPGGSVA